jgi:hypothetical protein
LVVAPVMVTIMVFWIVPFITRKFHWLIMTAPRREVKAH